MIATITVPNTAAVANNREKNAFHYKLHKLNKKKQADNAKDIDIVVPIYNSIEYTDNYSKTLGRLWHYYRDKPFWNDDGAIADFPADNYNSVLFKFKIKLAGRTENDGTKNVTIRVAKLLEELNQVLTEQSTRIIRNQK